MRDKDAYFSKTSKKSEGSSGETERGDWRITIMPKGKKDEIFWKKGN